MNSDAAQLYCLWCHYCSNVLVTSSQVHGGALIFAKMKHLVIEPPSETQLMLARRNESNLSHMYAREVKAVEARNSKKENTVATSEQLNNQEVDESAQAESFQSAKRPTTPGDQDKPQFRRKRAKVTCNAM